MIARKPSAAAKRRNGFCSGYGGRCAAGLVDARQSFAFSRHDRKDACLCGNCLALPQGERRERIQAEWMAASAISVPADEGDPAFAHDAGQDGVAGAW